MGAQASAAVTGPLDRAIDSGMDVAEKRMQKAVRQLGARGRVAAHSLVGAAASAATTMVAFGGGRPDKRASSGVPFVQAHGVWLFSLLSVADEAGTLVGLVKLALLPCDDTRMLPYVCVTAADGFLYVVRSVSAKSLQVLPASLFEGDTTGVPMTTLEFNVEAHPSKLLQVKESGPDADATLYYGIETVPGATAPKCLVLCVMDLVADHIQAALNHALAQDKTINIVMTEDDSLLLSPGPNAVQVFKGVEGHTCAEVLPSRSVWRLIASAPERCCALAPMFVASQVLSALANNYTVRDVPLRAGKALRAQPPVAQQAATVGL